MRTTTAYSCANSCIRTCIPLHHQTTTSMVFNCAAAGCSRVRSRARIYYACSTRLQWHLQSESVLRMQRRKVLQQGVSASRSHCTSQHLPGAEDFKACGQRLLTAARIIIDYTANSRTIVEQHKLICVI
eukprot:5839-Heterococcus_DN1.PRE.3